MPQQDLLARLGLGGEIPHLEEALTHPSFSNEHRRARGALVTDNQRLEFLGDAVLGLCVSELLVSRFPSADEGELSLMRSSIVNGDALATWARSRGLGAGLRLGRGADAAGERDQTNVLADAVEALVAAVYLDQGIDAARALGTSIADDVLGRIALAGALGRDAKSELQELVQRQGSASPRYQLVQTEGPDHRREFVVQVEIDSAVAGEGRGRSKKLAEQAAARAAIQLRFGAGAEPPLVTSTPLRSDP